MNVALDPAMAAPGPVDDALHAAAAAGYRHVELSNRPDLVPAFGAPGLTRPELRRIAGVAADLGLGIASVAVIQAWSSPDEVTRQQAVGWWRDGIAAAAELGTIRINTELSGDLEQREASREAFLRSFDSLRADLADAGITVAVEPHPNDFVETTAEALAVVRDAASAQLRYLHCLPHVFHLGGSTTEQIRLAGPELDHVHYADTFRPERVILNPASPRVRVHQHLDPGQGEIDFGEAALALAAVGFDGLLTVQVFAWPDDAARSFAMCHGAAERLVSEIAAAAERGVR